MSPWDLEPVDEDRRPNTVDPVPLLPSEVASRLYRPRPEDWGGDRDSECDRISAGLGQVMKLAIAEPFVTFVDLILFPYPMDLSIIKARLDNRFYRRSSAVEFDVNYTVTNALKFHQPESDIVRSASVITDLCLEIIRNRDAVDVPAIYQELLEKYEEGVYENADEPGTNGAEAESTSTMRTRSRRNLKISNSEPEKEKSKSSKSRNAVATCKSKVN